MAAVSPPDDPARLLRNGMAVVSFNALEDFLKQRMGEVLHRLAGGPIPFADLPDALQKAATVGATDALRYQARLRDFPGARDLIQETGRAFASIDNQRYRISRISFGYADANLNPETVKTMMACVGVGGGWGTLVAVSRAAGLNLPGLSNDYRHAMRRRHNAAHDPMTDTALNDLEAFGRQSLAIAMSFDALVSRAGYRLLQGDLALASGVTTVAAADIGIHEFDDLLPGRRSRWSTALAHARATGDLITVTRHGVPIDWLPGDLWRGRP